MCDSGECPSGKCPLGKMFIPGNSIQKTFRRGKVRWQKVRRRTVQIPSFCVLDFVFLPINQPKCWIAEDFRRRLRLGGTA